MREIKELPFRLETDGHNIFVYAVDEVHGVSSHVMTIYPGMLVALLKGMFEDHPYVMKPIADSRSFKFEARLDDMEGEEK